MTDKIPTTDRERATLFYQVFTPALIDDINSIYIKKMRKTDFEKASIEGKKFFRAKDNVFSDEKLRLLLKTFQRAFMDAVEKDAEMKSMEEKFDALHKLQRDDVVTTLYQKMHGEYDAMRKNFKVYSKPLRKAYNAMKAACRDVFDTTEPTPPQADVKPAVKVTENITNKRLISRTPDGQYFYKGQPMNLGEDSKHRHILDALLQFANQNGFLSYEDIENYLVEQGEEPSMSDYQRNKRIQNAITNGLFQHTYVGKGKLSNKAPDGHKLIDKHPGKGLKLYNPFL